MTDSAHIEIIVNDFALRSLRETADKDYVHARLAYRAGLIQQFLWSSLHCLEKYAKCILVLNRVDARKFKHVIQPALDKMNKEGEFAIELSQEVTTFVSRLEDGARFRYYETSYYTRGFELQLLDLAVWEIRRYCQVLDFEITGFDGTTRNMLEPNLGMIRSTLKRRRKGNEIIGGWLEAVIDSPHHVAREALLWKNLYFGKSRRKRVTVSTLSESGNSPLYLHPEALDRIAQLVHLPGDVRDAYKELHRKRLAGEDE